MLALAKLFVKIGKMLRMTPAQRHDLYYILGVVVLVSVVIAAAYFLS